MSIYKQNPLYIKTDQEKIKVNSFLKFFFKDSKLYYKHDR